MKWYVLISHNYQCDYACVCLFTSQESTLLSPQCSLKGWTATLFLPPTVCACMHVFVCRLFVQRLATETFSSLRTKLNSGYWLSRQPGPLSGAGSVFTLTYIRINAHTQTEGNPRFSEE